jgi:hypothetical protein
MQDIDLADFTGDETHRGVGLSFDPPLTNSYDAVNPPHYQRGPTIVIDVGVQITRGISVFKHKLQCIEVMRCIQEPRLATAFRYLWRVAFGGKTDPASTNTREEQDRQDIQKAIWFLQDWLDNKVEGTQCK